MPASPSPERAAARALRLSAVTLDHRGGDGRPFRVLDIPELTVPAGTHIGLRGPSGSGKTSLLHLIAGLIVPGTGTVAWGETVLSALPAGARDRWRLATLGFVFQDFHLIPELDILANITLPATFSSWRVGREEREQAAAVAARMGLTDLRRRTGVLSRGEQQRVAIARAVCRRPALILADEPTASLDAAHADEVGALLVDAAREAGATLICATHDAALLARMERRLDIATATQLWDAAA
ncbi:ABC transporter ATP-binding protein [Bosea sp. PAMC 26642]|uniref:ABC transporter ATP-binding protein n=1 Tax=Bosea sp. (strain PAMC 26642) TaxID=1792307 RepID=UPI0009E751CC|nr:ATP-binding cassette domain-containing protein [Bosea sp. PAMC 26642]